MIDKLDRAELTFVKRSRRGKKKVFSTRMFRIQSRENFFLTLRQRI